MNGIAALGGVTIDEGRQVHFGLKSAAVCVATDDQIKIEERDFMVTYDPTNRLWTAAWKWTDGKASPILQNSVKEYPPSRLAKSQFEEELKEWIKCGWLIPYDESKVGPARGLRPLMAIVRRHKNKVRPVLDFRELNTYVETFTAQADVCAHKLREWRRRGVNVSIIDLKQAYLQVRIDKTLWPYQTVVIKGRRYCLTRLGFGLNVAPLIMKTVLNSVLSQEPDVKKGTSAYIDDILVNEDAVKAYRVEQLARYGLSCKAHQKATDGARILGLNVWGEHGQLFWKRGNEVSDMPQSLTRRSVFSYCGELIGHYPICNWLRVATAFAKRKANEVSTNWDGAINDEELKVLLREIAARVKAQDPAHGKWNVSGDKARVWVDASSLALGVVLEVDDHAVENAAWLRRNDASHINMAELDAVIKGLNLALFWQLKKISFPPPLSMPSI
uniref:Reverse transcriptase domain-containing protein n=1 Tax=Trichuris muris TaxID=70415 RepID=A0A5S6QGD9_TRIMR